MQNWCTKHQLSHHSSRTDSVSNSFRDYRTFFNHSILSSASIRYRAWLIPYLSAIVDASYCSVPRSITVFVYIDVRLSISFVFLFSVLLDFFNISEHQLYFDRLKDYYPFPHFFACAIENFLVTVYSLSVTAILETLLDFFKNY